MRIKGQGASNNMPYGPCVYCGDTNYANSIGGPMVCPSCDCGDFGVYKVQRQAKIIEQLRERVEQLQIELSNLQEQ